MKIDTSKYNKAEHEKFIKSGKLKEAAKAEAKILSKEDKQKKK